MTLAIDDNPISKQRMFINGINIFRSELAYTNVAIKKSKNKRLQKKFIKRYGYKQVPSCIQTPMGIFMHPDLFIKLRDAKV